MSFEISKTPPASLSFLYKSKTLEDIELKDDDTLTEEKDEPKKLKPEPEMAKVAGWIARVLREGETAVPEIRAQVETMMAGYPLYA